MNGGHHGRLLYASNHAFIDGPGSCDAQRMAIKTSFAKKLAGSQDCDDCFLALLGNDSEPDLALLDVENRVRDLSLRENNLILPIFRYRFSLAHAGEKQFGIKRGFSSLPNRGSLFSFSHGYPLPDQGGTRRGDYGDLTGSMCWHSRGSHSATSIATDRTGTAVDELHCRPQSLHVQWCSTGPDPTWTDMLGAAARRPHSQRGPPRRSIVAKTGDVLRCFSRKVQRRSTCRWKCKG